MPLNNIALESDPYTGEEKETIFLVILFILVANFCYTLCFKTLKHLKRFWKYYQLDRDAKKYVKSQDI